MQTAFLQSSLQPKEIITLMRTRVQLIKNEVNLLSDIVNVVFNEELCLCGHNHYMSGRM